MLDECNALFTRVVESLALVLFQLELHRDRATLRIELCTVDGHNGR